LLVQTSSEKEDKDSSEKAAIGGKDRKRGKLCASNEFEREEKRDLQEILLHKLQLNLPEILKDEKRKEDLF